MEADRQVPRQRGSNDGRIGGTGDDTFTGGAGDDMLIGGTGQDTSTADRATISSSRISSRDDEPAKRLRSPTFAGSTLAAPFPVAWQGWAGAAPVAGAGLMPTVDAFATAVFNTPGG